jgi:hypothetical protein
MSKKLVKRKIDLADLPPLTKKQKAELAALAAQPEVLDPSELAANRTMKP